MSNWIYLTKKVKSNKQILCDKRKIFGNHIDYIYMRWSRQFFLSRIYCLVSFLDIGLLEMVFFSFPIWNCCVVCAYFRMWFLYTLTLLTDKMRSRASQSALSVCFFLFGSVLGNWLCSMGYFRYSTFFLVNWNDLSALHVLVAYMYTVCMCQCAFHGTFFGWLWDIDNLSSVAAGLLATTNTNYFSHFNQSISKTDVSI